MRHQLRTLLLLPILLLTLGCASLVRQDEPAPVSIVDSTEKSQAPLLSPNQILKLLETGQPEQAKQALKTYLSAYPDSNLARQLYGQLTEAPTRRYGQEHFKYVIKRGDTLGFLAQRYLGNSLEFYGLARYNHIRDPRKIRVGQSIKIPLGSSNTTKLLRQARNMFAKNQWMDAFRLLIAIPGSDGQFEQSRQLLEQGLDDFLKSLETIEARQQAEAMLVQLLNQSGPFKELVNYKVHSLRTKSKLEQSRRALTTKQLDQAFELFVDVTSPDDSNQSSYTELASELSEALHREAVVQFRNQQLNTAIELWDKVLKISPDHQSAKQYRDRAVKINSQLRQLQ